MSNKRTQTSPADDRRATADDDRRATVADARSWRAAPALPALVLAGVVLLALLVGVIGGVHRGLTLRPDWSEFAYETRYVWANGHTRPGTSMFGYLPAATFLLWPFTAWTPPTVGPVLWVLVNLAAVLGTLAILLRWWLPASLAFAENPPPAPSLRRGRGDGGASLRWSDRWQLLAVPAALAAPNLAHALQSNQLTALTLLLCVAGLTLVSARPARTAAALVDHLHGASSSRPRLALSRALGGLLLGAAIAIKTLPVLLVGYLVLRRRWTALAGCVLGLIVCDVLPSIAFFGVRGALDEHLAWRQRAGWHTNWQMIREPFQRVHRHGTNASLSAVLTRWLCRPPDAQRQVILYGAPPADVVAAYRAELAPDELLTIDPLPQERAAGTRWAEKRIGDLSWIPRWHVAELSAEAVWSIWVALIVLILGAIAWVTWRAPADEANWPALAALWMLTMFWPSPMTRHYYLAWALPALVVVWGARDTRLRWGRVLVAAALVGWLVGDACLGWGLARWYGVHVAALALLTAATVWAARKPLLTEQWHTATSATPGAALSAE